ncbi:MAG: threonine synthase [Reyranella sp.]|uniref:threonine synthase n=1 Tax=Reyranella sp. TaxID=1929291 RepID=UPI00272FB6B3|nr:threonine synthase [Reyranella sp.]MDP1967066.1 threonine synthase [Reyranella sp.]MDP2375567.1 threonine synthase [Reyranella sp.]
MRYISTRHGSQGTPAPLGFEDIMLAGLARDGGLYLPAEWPQFSTADINALKGLSYTELAFRVMRPFVDGAFDEATFRRLIAEAYASFETPDVAPLKPLGESGLHLLELFHGPTLAFKDVALQLLGRMLDQTLTARGQHATIVGATSGDTGSAAIEAVRDRKTIDIFMLFPKGRVSEVQRRQMTTVSAPNVHNIAVQGTFDDCQDLAKACFNDLAFRDRHALTAVNSINFARVMAQIVYYFWAALKLGAPERPVAFTVPSGNFGNVYAGYAAKQMGLPISHFVVGTNSNDILARFFESGTMTTTEVVPTLSPSMDIQISSNFERLLFDLYDRNGVTLADAMTAFRATGTLKVGANALAGVRALFDAGRVDEPGTLAAIADCRRRFGETIDPHTAVGYVVAQQHRRDPAVPMVVLATAHPAKFPDAVEKATGVRPPLPARLGDLMDRAERVDGLRNDIGELKAMIDERRAMTAASATRSKVRT